MGNRRSVPELLSSRNTLTRTASRELWHHSHYHHNCRRRCHSSNRVVFFLKQDDSQVTSWSPVTCRPIVFSCCCCCRCCLVLCTLYYDSFTVCRACLQSDSSSRGEYYLVNDVDLFIYVCVGYLCMYVSMYVFMCTVCVRLKSITLELIEEPCTSLPLPQVYTTQVLVMHVNAMYYAWRFKISHTHQKKKKKKSFR